MKNLKSQFNAMKNAGMSKSDSDKIRNNIHAFAKEHPVRVRKSAKPRFMLVRLFTNRTKPMKVFIVALIAVLTTGSGVTYAAQNDLPGDRLYEVKRVSEDAYLSLKSNKKDKADAQLKLAERRSDELKKLLERGNVNPELVKQTREDFKASVDFAENVAREVKDTDPKFAVDLAVRADRDEDYYISVLGQMPEEYRDDFSELLQESVGEAHENGEEFMDMMLEIYEELEEDEAENEFRELIQEEIQHELAEAKFHVDMLEQALEFAGTIDDEEAQAVTKEVSAELEKIQEAMREVEALIDSDEFNPERLQEIIDSEDIPALEELFAEIEDEFSDEKYEDYDYDGPWIEDRYDDEHAVDGSCHPVGEDFDAVECYEDGEWMLYDRDEFEEDFDDERYDYDMFEDEDDEHYDEEHVDEYRGGSYYDGETFHYDNEEDEFQKEVEKIRAEYDKDGDGEVDCIGEEDCPGQEFFEQYFDRECDELCEAEHERMIQEYEESMDHVDEFDEEDHYDEDYDEHDEYDEDHDDYDEDEDEFDEEDHDEEF